jgi:hypothetical protein
MLDMDVRRGVGVAFVTAGLLIAVPFVLSLVVREWNASTLTSHDLHVLSTFVLYAAVLGAAAAGTVYFYVGYKEGTTYRLLFGVASAAIIVAYSVIVVVASGLTSVLVSIGLQLDTTFVALPIAFASVILLFQAGEEYIVSGSGVEAPPEIAEAEPGEIP